MSSRAADLGHRSRSGSRSVATKNRIFANLPSDLLEQADSLLDELDLPFKRLLFEPNQPIPHVYFPISGVVSLIATLTEAPVVEIATVGNEGMVGLPAFLGADRMPGSALVQVPGKSYRIETHDFRRLAEDPRFTDVIHRYAQGLFNQIAQSTACNRVHTTHERTSRWLLMTHDRVGTDEFPMTQEFLSQMVGVRRAGVNAVAGLLQKAGLIKYSRGIITVVDRRGLERASCECYRTVTDEFNRLLPALRTQD